MAMKEFYLKKPCRKLRIIYYVVLLALLVYSLFTFNKIDFFYIYMTVYASIAVLLEFKQYNNISIHINKDILHIKWRGSFKRIKKDIQDIKEVNLSKNKLKIISNSDTTEYKISDFTNEQRHNLLTFFKTNFSNVTIN